MEKFIFDKHLLELLEIKFMKWQRECVTKTLYLNKEMYIEWLEYQDAPLREKLMFAMAIGIDIEAMAKIQVNNN